MGKTPAKESRSSLLQGAAIMGLAAVVSKVLGTMQKIPLQNIAGDRVFGLYNAVYPFYQLLLVLATAGFPVAVSLLVAERAASGDRKGARQVLRVSILTLMLTGAVMFVCMWWGADAAAGWIGDAAAAPAIRMSALALWTMPAVAALRGYYQGMGNMLPSAMSQVVEQLLRVAVMLLLLLIGWQLGWPDERLAAGATAGSAAGGCAALLLLAILAVRERRRTAHGAADAAPSAALPAAARSSVAHTPSARTQVNASGLGTAREAQNNPGLLRRLVALAFPVALGAIAVPMVAVVDAMTVPRLLQQAGESAASSMLLFGLYSRGQPLVQLVVMVAGAMASALVPALASARLRGQHRDAQRQAELALRIAWCTGLAAAVGIMALARPMNMMLYRDHEAMLVFILIGSTALAGTLNAITAALLPGLGAVRMPALLMLAAAIIKAVLNLLLVPGIGIAGAAWSGIAALTLAAVLGALAVRSAASALGGTGIKGAKGTGAQPAVRPAARRAAGMLLALAVMAAMLLLVDNGLTPALEQRLPPRVSATIVAIGGTLLGAAVFIAAALRFGGITADEVQALPGGQGMGRRLGKWRLLPAAAGEKAIRKDEEDE